MKKIALVLPEVYPVPAVKGGAIEELVTIMIEQNEVEHKAELFVFSIADEEAREQARNYRYTHMVYLTRTSLFDRMVNRVIRYTDRLLHRLKLKKKTMIDIAYYRRVKKYLDAHPVDAIVAEGGKYEQFRRFSQDYGKERLYLHVHHHLLCEPYIDGIYGGIIGISKFATNEWMRTTKDKSVKAFTVYNCVNEDKFNRKITTEEREEIRKQHGFSKEDTVVLYCGRILEVKGVRELVQAIIGLDDPHIRLLMIGSAVSGDNVMTEYIAEVLKLVEQADGRVQFTGYIDNEKLYRYYQSADIQVIPSLWEEAAGLIAIEGMLSGLPLIVTKSGGLVEYAPENVALQVERDGIVSNLERAIRELAYDPDKRAKMAAASIERAKLYPKRRFYESFIRLFE